MHFSRCSVMSFMDSTKYCVFCIWCDVFPTNVCSIPTNSLAVLKVTESPLDTIGQRGVSFL